jgi:hypothetical protein
MEETMREDRMSVEEIEVNGKTIEVQVDDTWCPGDRCWVTTATATVEGVRFAATEYRDSFEDAIELLIRKIKG